MQIKRKNEMKATLFIMVLVMTFIVTFVGMAVNYGFQTGFLLNWIKSWGLSFIVALPVVMFAMPLIKKFIASYVVDYPGLTKRTLSSFKMKDNNQPRGNMEHKPENGYFRGYSSNHRPGCLSVI